jgi:Type VI secretion system/phage-baseplate injector OB domain
MSADTNAGPKKFYGKYRGLVIDNIDPMQMGRIMAQVPDVLGLIPSSWAMPCVPFAGIQAGAFMVPPIGGQVWIEFEQGNPDYPIWTGGFWGTVATAPILATVPPAIPPGTNIVLQTPLQSTIVLSDSVPTPLTGGIILKSGASLMVINATGIYINAPIVAINETALVVVGP